MEGKDILPLVGVALGWALTQAASWQQRKRERQQRLDDLRLATYTEWATGMEGRLSGYARQQGGTAERHDVALCEKRLLLLEKDPAIRALIQAVHASLPDYGTPEYADFEMGAHTDPEWDWPPFRKAMDALLERVRRDLA